MEQFILSPISLKELQENLGHIFEQKLQTAVETINTYQGIKKDQLLTKKEVCKLLRISSPTLDTHIANGVITKHVIGRRVLFEYSNILSALTGISTTKYKRKAHLK
jgi:excisionase family DNA binding protein